MKKICLSVVGMYLMFLHSFSQTTKDTTTYQPKKLAVEEVNLVSSLYGQDGNHSAVTGGIGTEKVTDFANGLELKLVGQDANAHKHTLSFGLGIDHHTSASSAYVSKTGASQTGGTRIYPSVNWSVENLKRKNGFGAGLYFSNEYNYKSFGLDAEYTKKTNRNGEFDAKATAYFDKVKLIYPSELIPGTTAVTTDQGTTVYTTASGRTVTLGGRSGSHESDEEYIPSSPRNTYAVSLSFSQVFNQRLQGSITTDLVEQTGYLGLPFHRVYFSNDSLRVENLPGQRYKLPIGVRLNYFLGDKIIIRSYYRYYMDSWGIRSHTADIEIPIKITPFLSISPFYRYYTQTAAYYFAPYKSHSFTDTYYTSNYAYAAFNSNFLGVGGRIAPPDGIFKSKLSALEIRYGHYTQTTDLNANVISVALKFK
jgi:hypothetical protein